MEQFAQQIIGTCSMFVACKEITYTIGQQDR
jgi:hypothetical protein